MVTTGAIEVKDCLGWLLCIASQIGLTIQGHGGFCEEPLTSISIQWPSRALKKVGLLGEIASTGKPELWKNEAKKLYESLEIDAEYIAMASYVNKVLLFDINEVISIIKMLASESGTLFGVRFVPVLGNRLNDDERRALLDSANCIWKKYWKIGKKISA